VTKSDATNSDAAKSMAGKDPTIWAAASRWSGPEMLARRKPRSLQTNAVEKLGMKSQTRAVRDRIEFGIPKSIRLSSIIGAIALLTLSAPVTAEDRMVFGPRQFEGDKSGKGAVLCAWSIYLDIQAEAKACKLSRRPTDDAMDEAIAEIDDFILANSSLHPTRPMLEEFKRRRAAQLETSLAQQDIQKFCSRPDLEHFRSVNPDDIRASVRKMLETPREPVMNPCL
jgi:hypothetical protein